ATCSTRYAPKSKLDLKTEHCAIYPHGGVDVTYYCATRGRHGPSECLFQLDATCRDLEAAGNTAISVDAFVGGIHDEGRRHASHGRGQARGACPRRSAFIQ